MTVAIVTAVVLVGMIVALKWADRRDLSRGHRNRSMGDIRRAMRATRAELRVRQRVGYLGSPGDGRDR